MADRKKTIRNFLEYLPIFLVVSLASLMTYRMRNKMFAALGGFLVCNLPSARKRVLNGLTRVFPDMSQTEKMRLCKKIGQQVGRGWSEILFNARYKNHLDLLRPSGPGLEVLRQAKANGKGAIMFSGHFGQFDAARHYLKSQGMETGAVYRESNNPWYDPYFLHGLEDAGHPIVGRDTPGRIKMVKHLRRGGFFAMLVDQKFQDGELLPFLGHDALTSIAPAQLALRYKLDLVPIFCIRDENGFNIDIIFEEPIEHTDAITMTRAMNDRLSEQILKHPDQWYWLHQRWNDTYLYDAYKIRRAETVLKNKTTL
jgi:KDO2-lipid IV(A) lauroyltransferase